MFNFMKKDSEKTDRDERKSMKSKKSKRGKEKLPSGITADYSSFFAQSGGGGGVELDRGTEEILATANTTTYIDSNGDLVEKIHLTSAQIQHTTLAGTGATAIHSDSSESNHSQTTSKRVLPPIPPRPPKRGILKGPRVNITNITEEVTDSRTLLMRNTLQNELIAYQNLNDPNAPSDSNSLRDFNDADPSQSPQMQHLNVMTSPSPSAESLTDTTNSSFATPPFSLSPVGESQGYHPWARIQTFEDVSLPLPPIRLVTLPPPRELVIKRQKTLRNDFGFSLRKAIALDRSESLMLPVLKPVIFAEPGAGGGSTGLLPGDRLLKVNGKSVEDLPRETIIEAIRNSGDSLTVVVQPVAELVELSRRCMITTSSSSSSVPADETDKSAVNVSDCNTLKRSASKRFKAETKFDNNHANGDLWKTEAGENIWLVHRGGFCAALRLPQQTGVEPGKVLIQLEHNGEQLTVDEDDIEKANNSKLDLCEDICHLKHLNEASVLHVLRQRYASNLIHTRAGPILMVVNPMAPLSLYSEKVVSMFRGCKTEDMPPHVYSLAQTAYRTMMETRRDQSLIFMGRSASGKTTSFKHALYYLTLAAGSTNKLLTAEKVNAMNTILESFGNTKTCMNSNATRFTQILSLDFDHTGQIASASVQVLLLEKSRAGRRMSNEHTFHVLTRLLAGAEGALQKELHLDNINFDDSNPFISIPTKLDERAKASSDFVRLVQAFSTLGIPNNSVKALWCVLASIYHLGCAGATKLGTGTTARTQFAHPSSARKAAMLLGVSMDDLTAAAFPVNTSNPGTPTRSPADSPEHSPNAAWDSLEGLVIGLYAEAMSAAVALVNKAISSPSHTIASILLVDTPGFQNPASCGQQAGATLSDLRHNYLQERLQLLFHHTTLVAPRDRYAQELVEIDTEGFIESNPGPLVSLLDKAPQSHVMRTSQRDLRDVDRRGLLWLLDEESMYPNSNDDSFLERLFFHYGDREYQPLLRKGAGTRQFILQHLQGTNPVLYSTSGWLKASREHNSTKNATSLLQDSTKAEISHLFIGTNARGGNGIFFGSIAGVEGSQSLRRVSSIRRSFTTAGVKKNSVMLQVKFTVDGIIDTIRRTGTHFVHCFLLQHSAGSSSLVSNKAFHQNSEDIVNVPLLRSQLRGSQILEAARLHRLGFPETVPLTEFIRRFGLLADATSKDITVEQILSHNEIDPSCYRIGPSQMIMFGTSGNHSNSSKYKKRERTQNWCIDEKKYLLELCRKDMYIIENKRLDSALTSLKNRAWKIIYRKFCHTFGTDRNCNRIKEQWRRMKACARAEILDYQHRISKFGQDVADKKKPSAFTFEIWDFMQEAKKLCKNELTDEVDYSKIKLSLEENMSAEDLAMDDEDIAGSESSHSSNWANNSHNMCEVQMKEDSESRAMPNDLNGFFPQDNSDLLNYLKGQYLAHQQNEHLYRTNFSHKDNNLLQEQPMDLNSGDERLREHAMRMEILKVELETAKIKKEIAELNKEMLLKQLNEMK